MIKIVVIDQDNPTEVTKTYIGKHIFLMSANENEEEWIVDSAVVGSLRVNDLIDNLARAVTTQLKSLSDHIDAPYALTLEKFFHTVLDASEQKEPKGEKQ